MAILFDDTRGDTAEEEKMSRMKILKRNIEISSDLNRRLFLKIRVFWYVTVISHAEACCFRLQGLAVYEEPNNCAPKRKAARYESLEVN